MKLLLAIADPNIAEFFTVQRSTGEFAIGGWRDTKKNIKTRGNVSVATVTDVDAQPEGDRVRGAINVWCKQELFVTRTQPEKGVSDIVLWRGEQYRVLNVLPYPQRGYWKAFCVRMRGN